MRLLIGSTRDGPGSPRTAIASFLAFILLGLASAGAVEARTTVVDIYFGTAHPETLTIALDRIGILAREGVPADTLAAYAASFGLSHPVRWNTFIWTFDTAQALSRTDLVSLARQLKLVRSAIVAEAGMTVTIRGGTTPSIITDKFTVQFRQGVAPGQVDTLNTSHNVRVLEANVLHANHYLLAVTPQSGLDALQMANLYHQDGLVRYAHPNFIRVLGYRQFIPNDPRFDRQWHLRNTGQDAGTPGTEGTVGADIDAPEAWDIARRVSGAPTVTIAVIDGGFDLTHSDLVPNLWTNETEAAAGHRDNCMDDDGNGWPDDVHGYDFFPCDASGSGSSPCPIFCGDADPSYNPGAVVGTDEYLDDLHGTPVAGLIGAATDNGTGVAGVCPNARLMLVRRGFDDEHLAQAFEYCLRSGAKVINCSWGIKGEAVATATLDEEIDRVVMQGTVVLFAMDYARTSTDCLRDGTGDLAERPDVIAVSGSTNWDRNLSDAACGDYVDLLAPTNRGSGQLGFEFRGSLNIATTDIQEETGYNHRDWISLAGCPTGTESAGTEADAKDYTYCFTGTSAATPIAAGVAGLLLTVNPDLTPAVLQRLLQDTADKIEPSAASYDPDLGFSHPRSTPSTHGYGRVNAFEAVRVAAPVAAGGKGGVDLFVRDNSIDWGNTERPSSVTLEKSRGFEGYWNSMDVKVDAPPYQFTTTPTSRAFDESLQDEAPRAGAANRVYVRVRNRGPVVASGVKVTACWAYLGTAVPKLPDDFWSGFASSTFDQTDWHLIPELTGASEPGTVVYSGCTAVREHRESGTTDSEDAAVYSFEWSAPVPDPSLPDHYCILAVIDASGDASGLGADHAGPYQKVLDSKPLDAADFDVDALTPSDNNVTQRNYDVNDTSDAMTFTERFFVRNPSRMEAEYDLAYTLPRLWRVEFKPAPGQHKTKSGARYKLGPGDRRLVTVSIRTPKPGATGDVTFLQRRTPPKRSGTKKHPPLVTPEILGGLTIRFRPESSSPAHVGETH